MADTEPTFYEIHHHPKTLHTSPVSNLIHDGWKKNTVYSRI